MTDQELRAWPRFEIKDVYFARVLIGLAVACRPFHCEPMPDDCWSIRVREDDRAACREAVASRALWYYEDDELFSAGQPAANALWRAIKAEDAHGAAYLARVAKPGALRIADDALLRLAIGRELYCVAGLLVAAGARARAWWDENEIAVAEALRTKID